MNQLKSHLVSSSLQLNTNLILSQISDDLLKTIWNKTLNDICLYIASFLWLNIQSSLNNLKLISISMIEYEIEKIIDILWIDKNNKYTIFFLLLIKSKLLQQICISSITKNYTQFYRYKSLRYEYIKNLIWPNKTKILSIPCSYWYECFSLAIEFLKAWNYNFQITWIDIDEFAIKIARTWIFDLHIVNFLDQEIKENILKFSTKFNNICDIFNWIDFNSDYFYKFWEKVLSRCEFISWNIFDINFQSSFQIIICLNFFVYIADNKLRNIIISKLYTCLDLNWVLIINWVDENEINQFDIKRQFGTYFCIKK